MASSALSFRTHTFTFCGSDGILRASNIGSARSRERREPTAKFRVVRRHREMNLKRPTPSGRSREVFSPLHSLYVATKFNFKAELPAVCWQIDGIRVAPMRVSERQFQKPWDSDFVTAELGIVEGPKAPANAEKC